MPFWLYAPPVLALKFSLKGWEMLEQQCTTALQLRHDLLRTALALDEETDRSRANAEPFRGSRTREPAVIELR